MDVQEPQECLPSAALSAEPGMNPMVSEPLPLVFRAWPRRPWGFSE
jgi:hypothetical protein